MTKLRIVDTKRYTEKANNEQGGVGYETRLFYNFFQKQPQKLIVIKRGSCELPFYLNGWNYLDFTGGMTDENLDALMLKINDEAPYIMAPITKSPRAVKGKIVESALDGSIIPDLRVATQQGKDEYLKESPTPARPAIPQNRKPFPLQGTPLPRSGRRQKPTIGTPPPANTQTKRTATASIPTKMVFVLFVKWSM